jgi:hypothetical protein
MSASGGLPQQPSSAAREAAAASGEAGGAAAASSSSSRSRAAGGVGAAAAAAPPHPLSPFHLARHSAQPEFLRGFVAALSAVALTFPLNKAISRQAYEGLSWRGAVASLRADGVGKLYRGILPPLLQRGVSMGIMYAAYDFWYAQLRTLWYGDSSSSGGGGGEGGVGGRAGAASQSAQPSSWTLRAAAGVLAGSTEGLLCPFERVQTVLQHRPYTERFKNSAEATRALAVHGPRELYRGFTAILLRNAPSNALWFSLRTPLRESLPERPPWESREDGVRAGWSATAPAPATATSARDAGAAAPPVLLSHGPHVGWNIFRDFVSGAVLGAGISTLFFPLGVIKSVTQLEIGTPRHKGVLETAAAIVRERGVQGLYRGVHGNVARSLLSWGIINSVYELSRGLLGGGGAGGDEEG